MKFEKIKVYNFEGAFRGMRNPKNSWDKSDSAFGVAANEDELTRYLNYISSAWVEYLDLYPITGHDLIVNKLYNEGVRLVSEKAPGIIEYALIGPKDMKLAQQLINGGSEHRKFLRQIFISVDITAPLLWWKEFDTYKVGPTANSTSTMHKMLAKPITITCFEIDDYNKVINPDGINVIEEQLIPYLEWLRQRSIEYQKTDPEQSKMYWKELIRWLPESWLQTRTITMNYENAYAMAHQRCNHKLNEWSGKDKWINPNFMRFLQSLPYYDSLIYPEKGKPLGNFC